MTAQEAIKYIEQHAFIDDVVKDMAISAIKKQIPTKVRDNKFNIPFCPSCKAVQSGDTYCGKCGQKLKWW